MIKRDLICPQRDSFNFTFTVRDSVNGEPGGSVDLSGYSAASEVRDSLTNGSLVAEMQFTSTEEDLEEGKISLHIPAETMRDIPVGTYFYDIVLFKDESVVTYFIGKFVVTNKVTRNV
jgi:hypothetical protein